jgi:hypothetical protein
METVRAWWARTPGGLDAIQRPPGPREVVSRRDVTDFCWAECRLGDHMGWTFDLFGWSRHQRWRRASFKNVACIGSVLSTWPTTPATYGEDNNANLTTTKKQRLLLNSCDVLNIDPLDSSSYRTWYFPDRAWTRWTSQKPNVLAVMFIAIHLLRFEYDFSFPFVNWNWWLETLQPDYKDLSEGLN